MINEDFLDQEQDERGKRYLTFFMDNQLYAISAMDVVQIIGMQTVTKLPDSPSYIKGVMNLRGEIMPVIDVRLRLGIAEADYTDRTCIIIMKIQGNTVGFIVDEVDEVLDIRREQISVPPMVNHVDASGDYLIGIGRLEDRQDHKNRMVLIIDASALLGEREFELLTKTSEVNV